VYLSLLSELLFKAHIHTRDAILKMKISFPQITIVSSSDKYLTFLGLCKHRFN
jgi:hypothetical protein